jgi:hypothetical protein
MINIYDSWLIQIDVTNACIKKCAHCTRAVRYFKTYYFADLDHIEKSLQSLKGWKYGVGCMGGEPTLHPKFPEICGLFRKYFPKERCGLWTCGGRNYDKYRKIINNTFGIICYNEHKTPSHHQPMLVASEEIIEDEKLRNELIDDCWLQKEWSPAITVKGAFFCEVAATIDLLYGGPGGYELEPLWWNKSVEQFKDQRDRYCKLCSISIPLQKLPDNIDYELISSGNFKRLNHSDLQKQNFVVVDKSYTKQDIDQIRRNNEYNPEKYNEMENLHSWFKVPMNNKYGSRVLDVMPCFTEKKSDAVKSIFPVVNFAEPNQIEKNGIIFDIDRNVGNGNYSIGYEGKVYSCDFIKKQSGGIVNPFDVIRSKQLMSYFDGFISNKKIKNIMSKADFFLFDSIQPYSKRKITVGQSWTEFSRICTDIDKAKRIFWMEDAVNFEGRIDGTFLGAVDKYHFMGIVENDGTRYAVIEADMSLIINCHIFGSFESKSFINKGIAQIAYEYGRQEIQEITYDGFYNCYSKGSLISPLCWTDNIRLNDDMQGLKNFIIETDKKFKIGRLWKKDAEKLADSISEIDFNSMVINAKSVARNILYIFSNLSSDQVLTVIDNGLRSIKFRLKHDKPVKYKSYYRYDT